MARPSLYHQRRELETKCAATVVRPCSCNSLKSCSIKMYSWGIFKQTGSCWVGIKRCRALVKFRNAAHGKQLPMHGCPMLRLRPNNATNVVHIYGIHLLLVCRCNCFEELSCVKSNQEAPCAYNPVQPCTNLWPGAGVRLE